ncbi:hypothetical protein BHE74_00052122 [Ensete ventricosum]|nr:hypothetical protein BHE74_00052122 [Ensete ventricosum]
MRLWQREEDEGWPMVRRQQRVAVVRTVTADGRRQWPWPARDVIVAATTVFRRRKRGQRSRRRLWRLQWQRKQGAGAAQGAAVAAREDGSGWKRLDSSRGKRGIEFELARTRIGLARRFVNSKPNCDRLGVVRFRFQVL